NARTAGGAQALPDTDVLPILEDRIFAYWPDLVALLQGQFNADYVALDNLPARVRDRYLSVDGKWRIDLLPKADVREPANLKSFVGDVEAVFPDIAGGAIQSEKAGQIIARSMIEASAFALIVITVMLFLFVPNPVTVILMLFPLGLAAILTIATGVLVDVPFNYANVIVLPLLMGIGIDSGIHLVLRQRKLKRKIDHADGQSVYGTATPRAVLFSALTTVASFGSLMLSSHRGTASMGELLSISIGYTLVCTLIVLPAVFRFRERRAKPV
ncbi:MAG: MMPL family transporter, partial [Pseudomonadota bacterium]